MNELMEIIGKTGKENNTFTARTCQRGNTNIDYHEFSLALDELAYLGFIKRVGIDNSGMIIYSLYK